MSSAAVFSVPGKGVSQKETDLTKADVDGIGYTSVQEIGSSGKKTVYNRQG